MHRQRGAGERRHAFGDEPACARRGAGCAGRLRAGRAAAVLLRRLPRGGAGGRVSSGRGARVRRLPRRGGRRLFRSQRRRGARPLLRRPRHTHLRAHGAPRSRDRAADTPSHTRLLSLAMSQVPKKADDDKPAPPAVPRTLQYCTLQARHTSKTTRCAAIKPPDTPRSLRRTRWTRRWRRCRRAATTATCCTACAPRWRPRSAPL